MRPSRLLLLLYFVAVKGELQLLTDCVSSAAISIELLGGEAVARSDGTFTLMRSVSVIQSDGTIAMTVEDAADDNGNLLGLGTYSMTKVAFGNGLTPASSVSSGIGHTCILSSGKAYCIGSNYWGQLYGKEAWDGSESFREFPYNGTIARVFAFGSSTCILSIDNELWCVGQYFGREIMRVNTGSLQPMAIILCGRCILVATEGNSTTSNIYCWGNRSFGSDGYSFDGDHEVEPIKSSIGIDLAITASSTTDGGGLTCVAWLSHLDNLLNLLPCIQTVTVTGFVACTDVLTAKSETFDEWPMPGNQIATDITTVEKDFMALLGNGSVVLGVKTATTTSTTILPLRGVAVAIAGRGTREVQYMDYSEDPGPLMCAVLDDSSIQCLHSNLTDFAALGNALSTVKPYRCSSQISAVPNVTDSLQAAFQQLEEAFSVQTLVLQPGVYNLTSALVLNTLASPDFRMYGTTSNPLDTVIHCNIGDTTQPCLSVNGAYSVGIRGITFISNHSNAITRKLAATASQALKFTNVEVISLTDVAIQGFSGTSGAAMMIECTEAKSCSDVTMQAVKFVNNTATDYGGALALDISVTGTSFKFTDTQFTGNTAGIAGGAVYWQRHAINTNECTATASQMNFTGTSYTGNKAVSQWGNDIASDTCKVAFAVTVQQKVESGMSLMDNTSTVPPLLQALDHYGSVVLSENSLSVAIPNPVSTPVTSSYIWQLNTTFIVTSGTASLQGLTLNAQPASSFAFTVTASDAHRSFSTGYTARSADCQPGSYRELTTDDNTLYTCERCSAGSFTRLSERLTCTMCAANFYCETGAHEQTPCPTRYISSAGSGTCVCDGNFMIISNVTGCTESSELVDGTHDCPTDGSKVLTIHGNNFGTSLFTVSVGGQACEVIEKSIDLVSVSDSSYSSSSGNVTNGACLPPKGYARCQLPAGTGTLQFVTLTDITGSISSQLLSYAAPVVLATTGCNDDIDGLSTKDCPRHSNHTIITVTGTNFGPQHGTILIGGVIAEQVKLSDYGKAGLEQTTAMALLPYGSGTQLTVNVIQKGGEISEGKKQLSYKSCGLGKYNTDPAKLGYFVCSECAAGYSNEQDEAYSCQICKEGFYCNTTDSISCKSAIVGSTSILGSESSDNCTCPVAQMAYEGKCQECPAGFNCTVRGLTVSNAQVMPGYWRTSLSSADVRSCGIEDLCIGGTGSGDGLCVHGQRGPYCNVCAEGYAKSMANTCKPCTARTGSIIIMGIVIGLLLAIVVAVVYWRYFKQRALETDSHDDVVAMPQSPCTDTILSGTKFKKIDLLVQSLLQTLDTLTERAQCDDNGSSITVPTLVTSLAFFSLVLTQLTIGLHDTQSVYAELSDEGKQATLDTRDQVHEALVLLTVQLQSVSTSMTAANNTSEVVASDETAINTPLVSAEVLILSIVELDCKLRAILPEEAQEGFSGIYKVAITSTQILGAMQSVFSIQFPPLMAKALDIGNFVNLSFMSALSIGCVGSFNFYSELLFKTITPLIIAAVLLGAYVAVKHIPKLTSTPTTRATVLDRITGAFLVLTYTVLPGVSTSIFQAFSCEQFDDGSAWLRIDYSISCDASRYSGVVAYAATMMVIYPIGIPVMYFVILWRNRDMLNPVGDTSMPLHLSLAAREVQEGKLSGFGFLYKQYKPNVCWWFELFETARRLVMLVTIVVHVHWKPFCDGQANQLGVVALMLNFITLFAALLIKIYEVLVQSNGQVTLTNASTGSGRAAMGVVLFAMNLFVIAIGLRILLQKLAVMHSNNKKVQHLKAYVKLDQLSPKAWSSPVTFNIDSKKMHHNKRVVPVVAGLLHDVDGHTPQSSPHAESL
eukprot:16257-Heterococcus_DN1.PRE.3